MAKIGNEAKLILKLAFERLDRAVDGYKAEAYPGGDMPEELRSEPEKLRAANREGRVRGIEEAKAIFNSVVLEVESK